MYNTIYLLLLFLILYYYFSHLSKDIHDNESVFSSY